jgi:hypothetical protein
MGTAQMLDGKVNVYNTITEHVGNIRMNTGFNLNRERHKQRMNTCTGSRTHMNKALLKGEI